MIYVVLALSFLIQSTWVGGLVDTWRQVNTTSVGYKKLALDQELTLKYYRELKEVQDKLVTIEENFHDELLVNEPSSLLQTSERAQLEISHRNIE